MIHENEYYIYQDMKLLKIVIITTFAFFINFQAFSQNNEIDSLTTLLDSGLPDTTYVKVNNTLAVLYLYTDTDTAVYFASNALKAAKETNSLLQTLKANKIIGSCYVIKGDLDRALTYLYKSLEMGVKLIGNEPNNKDYKRIVSGIYGTLGIIYYNRADYDLAIENHHKSLKLSEEIGFDKGIAICLSNLGIAYMERLDYQKALKYHYKALKIAKKMDKVQEITQSLNNLGAVYLIIQNYDSAYFYISKCIIINREEGNETELIINYENLAHIFDETGKLDSALFYNEMALKMSEQLNNMEGMVDCNYRMAEIYYNSGDYGKAEKYSEECLKLAIGSGMQYLEFNANEQLSNISKAKGDYKNAYQYFVAGSKVHDSIFNTESDERIAEMEAKYKTEKKEEEIILLREKTKLHKEKAKSNKLIFISITIILILVLGLSIISYRSAKHKQLAEKRGLQQKAEKNVLEAVIETEYKERKRFAEDLHDGLGVMLSTLRLYINELTDKERTDEEKQQLLDQSNSMLDDAIGNARNISNNIMPSSLKNNGLEITLKSYCDKINASGKIKIALKSTNLQKHHKDTIEITLFRVLTEMINNTLKHSGASQVEIALTENQNNISITYKDNGKGFDIASVKKLPKKGMGLNNIYNRVNSIGGTCTIESSVGNGFFSIVEIEV
ncbi:MAG: hypothetical protein DRJ05_18675 [Bacteroidetes bacterium]|nr:MAG: hypothetical protein DRJ05_18675 [Bacteroidota bacterium]